MKIKNITNPQELFKKLKECEGTIELITAEGDRLNLKSKLCQYIIMMNIFNNAQIEEIELSFSNEADILRIIDYLVKG